MQQKNTWTWVPRRVQRGETKHDKYTRTAIRDKLRIHEEMKLRQAQEVDSGNDSSDDDDGGDGANDTNNEH